jgi:phage portal protein, SPP1 gp6-like
MSMQPHTEQLRQWAALLAAESSIPLDELGFPSDNPSSDSAIQSQRDPLRLAAERCIRGFQSALRQVAVLTVALRHGWETAQEATNVQAHFAPTVQVSDAAAADAVLKQVQVMPWLAESGVVLEKLGYSAATAERLMNDKRRAEGVQALGFYKQYKERKDAEKAQRQEKLAKQPLGEFEVTE